MTDVDLTVDHKAYDPKLHPVQIAMLYHDDTGRWPEHIAYPIEYADRASLKAQQIMVCTSKDAKGMAYAGPLPERGDVRPTANGAVLAGPKPKGGGDVLE